MVIKVAHLYYDLMNLYGDSGNVKALEDNLKKQGIEVIVDKLSVDDKIDFNAYDVFIIGSGTESNVLRALHNLRMYKDEVQEAIESGKVFLCTGNAYEMFGKRITDIDGNLYNGLNIFDFDSLQTTDRLVSEYLYKSSIIDKHIIGFQNIGSKVDNYKFNLFEIVRGEGSDSQNKMEGIHYKNFFGTHTIGPLLVRNPELLIYFIKLIINLKDKQFIYNNFSLELDYNAYNEFMNNHYPIYNLK